MSGEGASRSEILSVKDSGGSLSLELMRLREGVARGFLKQSPRNLRLGPEKSAELSESLSERCRKILVADNRKKLLAKSLATEGWRVRRAVSAIVDHKCSMCTTYDLPLDEQLLDDRGDTPDITNTSHMAGVSIGLEDRRAYGFFTDEGDTARVVSEGARKQGMLVACSPEDMAEAASCLVRFLAASKKKWAVFSVDMGRFIRQFDPTTMWRMALESPRAFDHTIEPLSKGNRKQVVRLFSEYYDVGSLQASMKLRGMTSDKAYSVFFADGGFVVTKLEGETGLVYDIYVTPSRQGQGLGGELMRCALTSLAGRASSVYLHTSYPRAKALYEKFGFKASYSQLSIRLDELALEPPSR